MSTHSDPIALFWLDIETTGLNSKLDAILEIAWHVTDIDGNHIPGFTGRSFVLEQIDRRAALANLVFGGPSFVRSMHMENGLLQQLLDNDSLTDIRHAREALIADTAKVKELGYADIRLAGRSVHFDRGFLDAYCWDLSAFSHRIHDLTPLLTVAKLLGVEFPETESNHRASDDVAGDVEDYRHLLASLEVKA